MTSAPRSLCLLLWTACLGFASLAPDAVFGQPGNPPQVITLQQKVEPSFRIEPVVHRFQANRGQVVPFEFLMTSTGREMDVEMKVVELRQEENGIILHKENGKPAAAVTFTSPVRFTLAAGDVRKITGEITVPAIKSNFHSFGILVRDKGQMPTFAQPDKAKKSVQAGVHFVTQYVLRCDIEIGSANDNDMSQVELLDGGFRVQNGLPAARVWVNNPTDNAFEFNVRGALQPENTTGRPELLQLGMASRASLPEPEKYLIRIMPHSRLLLEAPVSTSLVPGPVGLSFAIHNGRREVVTQKFAAQVAIEDFPALDVAAVRLNDAVVASPGQVLLSRHKGGKRSVSVRLTNSSQEAQEVRLQLRSLNDQELDSAQLSSETIHLPAHRSQNVRVTLRSQKETKLPQFGYLQMTTAPAADAAASSHAQIPVALYDASAITPDLEFAPLETVSIGGQPAFRVLAVNKADGFTPVHGELSIVNELGQRMQLTAGYNKWIKPQESFALLFRPESEIPLGKYQATLTLHSFEHLPPKVLTTDFALQAVAGEPPSRDE